MSTSRLELRPTDYEDFVDVMVDEDLLVPRLLNADPNPRDHIYEDDTGLGWGHVDSVWHTVFDQDALIPGTHRGIIFTCGCNWIGCSDTAATISVTESTITLNNFIFPHRPPIATPITFDREQFIAEVSKTNAWYANKWPEDQRRKIMKRANARPRNH